MLQFWRPGPKGRKMAAKRWLFFVKGRPAMNLDFFVAGQISMKFVQKCQSVSSIEPIEEFRNFPLKG